ESAAWGLLAFADSLEQAQKARVADLEPSIRLQLGGWGNVVHPLRTMVALGGGCSVLAISPDGKILLTGDFDGSVRLWDGEKPRMLRTGQGAKDVVITATFTPDGSRVLMARQDGTVQVWEVASARLTGPLLPHPGARLSGLVCSQDGKSVLTLAHDGTIRVWTNDTGKPRGE